MMKATIQILICCLLASQNLLLMGQDRPRRLLLDDSENSYLLDLRDFFARDRIEWRYIDRVVLRGVNFAFVDPGSVLTKLQRRYERHLLPGQTDFQILRDSLAIKVKYAADSSYVIVKVLGQSYRFFVQKKYHGEDWLARMWSDSVPGSGLTMGQRVHFEGFLIVDPRSYIRGDPSDARISGVDWVFRLSTTAPMPEMTAPPIYTDGDRKMRLFPSMSGQTIVLNGDDRRIEDRPEYDTLGNVKELTLLFEGREVCKIDGATYQQYKSGANSNRYPKLLIPPGIREMDESVNFFKVRLDAIYFGRQEYVVERRLYYSDRYLLLNGKDDKWEYLGSFVFPASEKKPTVPSLMKTYHEE
jgi:hypothetical protein